MAMLKEGPQTHKERERIQFSPSLVVFVGSPAVGKSTLAQAIAEKTNFIHLDVDAIRLQLFHRDTPILVSREQEREEMVASYREMHERARKIVAEGSPALLTAVYSREQYHTMVKDLQAELGVPLHVFYLETPPQEEVEKRLAARRTKGSDSNVTTYQHFASVEAAFRLIDGVNLTRLPASLTTEQKMAQVLSVLTNSQ